MGFLDGMKDPARDARSRMEREASAVSRRWKADEAEPQGSSSPRRPGRYRLYDRIKGRVSVSTMNVIIGATVLLLILALVVGIATGTPQR